ncbi:NAD(P)/FAD-dependent oxidoreductase [Parvibaculum sp.]|jgi:cyclohexanone monooxygenase|uniref:flavin-containing monooxygenase n=1 Tax=Parvibaculum sp. TaxID=2024848 RepID=UPI000C51BCB4|nr:NAD(P)/FAD-dependent oxidoreductase [Parvibaculum sp.]MAM95419.1 cyclohexanone monooxygenase [Parvibaculum sp.]HCX67746.1 cyclohexanone monooxygenase [Rhodobiaceae bacterium]|tara:strand:+ start:5777 stop:7411 length:1635 start_codon:yes stop_codon:yes gene_type:complete
MAAQGENARASAQSEQIDAVIVGAGFAGMYMLHRLRELGLSVQVFEAGDSVGGTWYWNRYPGARCDVESLEYQYGFSDEIQRGWTWSERYAAQPEILRYQNYVADKLDLRRDIRFETRVTSAKYNERNGLWVVETDKGDLVSARFCIMATGCLSAARIPDFDGLDDFEGEHYHTGGWPHEGVDFSGQRVAVIGTGSSGIQSIPVIAEQAKQLTVFQRTANFTLPAGNRPLRPEEVERSKETLLEDRRHARETPGGIICFEYNRTPVEEMAPDALQKELETRWKQGGFAFLGAYGDLMATQEANQIAAEFARTKMRASVKNKDVAEKLLPVDHPIGVKRLCLDTDYLETFDKPHVDLVDLRENSIERISRKGVVCGGKEYEADAIVFATGFDAMTGALLAIDIRGRNGAELREKWAAGPRTYLGLGSAGFPNLFFITGPGSPSVLSNMIVSIEQHVDWITDCVKRLTEGNIRSIEATREAEDEWVAHVNELASGTLYPQANSWYMGANIPGKPRVFMPYTGGVNVYGKKIDAVAAADYEGFQLGA